MIKPRTKSSTELQDGGSTGRGDSNHHKRQKSNRRTKGIPSESWEILAPCWMECSSWAHSLMKHIFVGQEQRVIKTKDSCSQSYHFSRFGRDHSIRHACHRAHASPGETSWDKHFRSYSGWDGRARRSGNKPEMSQEQESLSLIGDGWVSTAQWYRRVPMQPFHFLLPVQLLDELWYIQT